jgi:queuosine precursor transporter
MINTPKIMPYKYIIFLSMLFTTINLASASVAYKMVYLNSWLELLSGATFIFPITYCLGDIVTEVYGYNMARNLIWLNLILQFVYAVLVTAAIYLPEPGFWKNHDAYITVFGSMLRFVSAGTAANIISNFMNIYIVSKLKIPCEGKLFWVRSLLSTIVSGFLLVAIVIVIGFSGKNMNFHNTWIMFKSTFSLEIMYALVLVIPAALTASFLKRSENIDVYDYETNFNPFIFK